MQMQRESLQVMRCATREAGAELSSGVELNHGAQSPGKAQNSLQKDKDELATAVLMGRVVWTLMS